VNAAETVGEVRVFVHPPYMLQTTTLIDDQEAFGKLARRHRDRLVRVNHARDCAPGAVKALLDRHFYDDDGQEELVARGRSPLEEIKSVLQDAVDRRLIPADASKSYPDSHDLRQWLKTYGIGVDCSAFVQQALARVVRACSAATGEVSGESQSYEVGWMLSRGVYREINAAADEDSRFERVPTPGEARPGDVLVKRGHIRIVAGVEAAADGGVILDLAESTSAKGIPTGLSDVDIDIGPRLIRVKYPEPDRTIDGQILMRQRWHDGAFALDAEEHVYILGRLKALVSWGDDHE
jgi:hypothetical protein